VTDARYYSDLSRNAFRFLPLRLTPRDLDRVHGIDERIGVNEYETAIRMYRQLLIEATGSRRFQTVERGGSVARKAGQVQDNDQERESERNKPGRVNPRRCSVTD
jgi:hypothetical protein